MKFAENIVLVVFLSAFLGIDSGPSDAAQARKFSAQRGGQGGANSRAKGSVHGNPQWFADPERGWVRAEEHQELKGERSAPRQRGRNQSRKGDQRSR